MKRCLRTIKWAITLILTALPLMAAQANSKDSCTPTMVGKQHSAYGNVITSHTCMDASRAMLD